MQSMIAQGRLSLLLGLFIIHSLAAAVVVTLFLKRLAVRGWFPRRRLA
jgi:hypothetical protein